MTLDEVQAAFVAAGFCGIEGDQGVIYARIAPQAPEFRAELCADGGEGLGWRLVLPWNVRPPQAAIAAWNALMGAARMEILAGEACLVMPFPDRGVLIRWAELAAEAEVHFIRWRRERRPAEGM